jgi:CDP-4-dehydro-6-deoxyglucose reductase
MSHLVTIQESDRPIQVENGETVLDAAERQGITLPYGCRNGACGTCRATLVSGSVDYGGTMPTGLSEEEAERGEILLCQARPLSDCTMQVHELESAADIPVRRLRTKVAAIDRVASDVIRLRLTLPEGERLLFLAGQYIDILLPEGARRAFSLANAPHDDAFLELHIRRVPGGRFTSHVFDGLQVKDLLTIEGPLGSFYLREESRRPVLLVAGGTGFGPIKSIFEHMLHIGSDRPVRLFRGARDVADLYLDEIPRGWEQSHDLFRYTPVLSAPAADSQWRGRTGLVVDAVIQDIPDLAGYDVYMCGPPPMIEAAKKAFTEAGLPAGQLFYDSFVTSGRSQGEKP